MAEADGIGAAAAAPGRDDQVGGLVETLRKSSSSCDALAVADDEPSELYVTAPEEVEASSSKCIGSTASRRRLEQLPSRPKASADDEYWTARRRRLEQLRSECGSESEFEMAKSQEHWTVVGEPSSELDLVFVDNRQHFQSLRDREQGLEAHKKHRLLGRERFSRILSKEGRGSQSSLGLGDIGNMDSGRFSHYLDDTLLHSKCKFFVEFGDGELVMGEKIGEGGQAEIFKASFRGQDKYVLKVFKPDISLADLERNWTIQTHEGFYYEDSVSSNCCFMKSGTLLKDGRFAFLMQRYWGDLRKLIDHNMTANNKRRPPFSPSQALHIMHWIAEGMVNLHWRDILHRDLKASNVLIKRVPGHSYDYVVADFESSGGVQGTGFWRAPEVLQLLKDKVRDPSVWKNMWSERVDVYGYAMTSYEVLTGHIPLGHLAPNDYDAVLLRGERPLLPDYVDPRIRKLLSQCWHSNPLLRPTFLTIVRTLYKFGDVLSF